MRTKQILTALAVVGTVATLGLINFTEIPSGLSFAAAPKVDAEVEKAFVAYITEFEKNYATKDEYNQRLAVFAKNYHKIALNNMSNDAHFSMAINEFTDMSEEEFKSRLGYNPASYASVEVEEEVEEHNLKAPGSVDWRNGGFVSRVKNQGGCGSCWAFSATGAIESFHAITTRQMWYLSEQQMVDCDGSNNGCGGGSMYNAMWYAHQNPQMAEGDYPYHASRGGCAYDRNRARVGLNGAAGVAQNNVGALKDRVAQQPTSVAIDASALQSYGGGVIYGGCGTGLNHGVLVVGYANDYWIVKNSWGDRWGEGGFFRLAIRDGQGTCGVQMQPVFPY